MILFSGFHGTSSMNKMLKKNASTLLETKFCWANQTKTQSIIELFLIKVFAKIRCKVCKFVLPRFMLVDIKDLLFYSIFLHHILLCSPQKL